MMNRTRKTLVALLFAAAAACNADGPPQVTRATLDGTGMTPLAISAQAFAPIEFVNGDDVGHQIYSYDCAELSTPFIEPGDTVTVYPGAGPKACHLEDLRAPDAIEFRGVVDVQPAYTQPSDG